MKQTVSRHEFINSFNRLRPNNFTYRGLNALYDMQMEYELSTGQETELDVIALCCEYAEYDSMEDFWQDYDQEKFPDKDSIIDETFYCAFGEGDQFIIQMF